MIYRSLFSITFAVCCALLVVSAGTAQAQSKHVKRIQQQQQVVSDLRSNIADSITETRDRISDLENGRTVGDIDAIDGLYSAIEADTRAVLTSISFQSDFRDALDDLRAQIESMIARNMREPESARRDARLMRLQELKTVYQQQYDSVSELEQRLIFRLADLNTEKRAAIADAEVDNLAGVIQSLQTLVDNLEKLELEVTAVATADTQDPMVSQ